VAIAAGDADRLHLAIECYACFEWLMPVLARFKTRWSAVDVFKHQTAAHAEPERTVP